jgi:hypothetical protein
LKGLQDKCSYCRKDDSRGAGQNKASHSRLLIKLERSFTLAPNRIDADHIMWPLLNDPPTRSSARALYVDAAILRVVPTERCVDEMLHKEPRLQLVASYHIRHNQIIRAIIVKVRRARGSLMGIDENDFVCLEQSR